jgi:hypothetical protein
MKLSDAIRKGSEKTYKIIAVSMNFDSNKKVTGTCALGAALVGLKGSTNKSDLMSNSITEEFGLKDFIVPREYIPEKVILKNDLVHVITSLNDYYRWSRKAIAEWIAHLEDEGVITYDEDEEENEVEEEETELVPA